jgi:hypothetical protein
MVRWAVSAPDRKAPSDRQAKSTSSQHTSQRWRYRCLLVAAGCLHDSGYSTCPSPGSQPIILSYIMGHTLRAQIKCTFRAVIKPHSMLITDSTINTTLQMAVSSFNHHIQYDMFQPKTQYPAETCCIECCINGRTGN